MITLQTIRAAADAIDTVFLDSPQFRSETLGVTLKVETINPIRCFKGRGASYYVACLTSDEPLVCASAGNFGQGLAYAARARCIPVYVFAAENANPLKIRRMRFLGAEIHQSGSDFDEAKVRARDFAVKHGYRWVEDGREPEVAAGAGTIGLELAQLDLDAVIIPVGNGALISGIGAALKELSPETRVIGVCAAGAPCMEQSWRTGTIVTTRETTTFADGIAVRSPVPEALDMMDEVVDEIVMVDDSQIAGSMRRLYCDHGLLAEPAGAAGIAAWLSIQHLYKNQNVATVICGANVTEEQVWEHIVS